MTHISYKGKNKTIKFTVEHSGRTTLMKPSEVDDTSNGINHDLML